MKSYLQKSVIMFLVIFFSGNFANSANEHFRSVASGNWNANSTWEMSTNGGGTWFAATSTPRDTSGPTAVRSPNTVTVTVSVTSDQLTVNTGGTISINTGIILTITNGGMFLNNGGAISGLGTLQTQGTGVTLDVRGSGFTAAFKVNTGTTSCYDATVAPAVFNGSMTIDAGATLAVFPGGYTIQANGTVTNNGEIISGGGGIFLMNGPSLVNNDTIKPDNLRFNSTTSLSGTGAYRSSAITILGTGNVSLANNLTFSPTSSLNINNGGILNPNTRTLTFNSGTCFVNNGGTVSNSGTFQTQGTVSMIVKNGSNFNGPFRVNSGTTTSNDDGSPYIANYKGTLTVDAGAILTTQGGGYSNRAYGNVTNNGTITGNNFIMRGPSLNNSGVISSTNCQFDSTTALTSTGNFTGSTITIGGTGNVTLISNVLFTPTSNFTINNGGILQPGTKTFTFASGSFILNTGAVVAGLGPNAGTMQSQNNVTFIFRNGTTFNSAIKVNTGTLTAYNDQSPYFAVYNGTITVDAGATLTQAAGGYTTQAMNAVTNNGTITSPFSGANFRMRGPTFTNNSSVTCQNLSFDSTTTISGTGTYTCQNIFFNAPANVSLANNVTFSPSSTMTVANGATLNPNTRTLTLNSGALYVNNGGTIFNSGIFQTQGTVSSIVRAGANFNAAFKVNSGTTTSNDVSPPYVALYKGSITIDAGATLTTTAGGYAIQANSIVTNNGTIMPVGGANFRMRGPSLINNSSITGYSMSFDSTTTISGNGSYTPIFMSVSAPGNVSLANNVTFSPSSNFTMTGGVLNPNTFTLTAAGNFYFNNTSTVSNSGTFRTQGSTTLLARAGCNFNAPLKVNTGTTFVYDDAGPFIGVLNGSITVDTGATLSSGFGGYTIRANSDVTINGTLSAVSPDFRMYGTNFINNGTISFNNLYFQSGAHTLSGTGTWNTNANILSGAVVTLGSNHKMSSITINGGGTFNVSTFRLSVSASNPIGNSGTFNTTTGAVEYNGTSSQSISTTNITYNKLRINNPAGTSLPGAVTVNDTLSVILGDLNLNGQVLTLSPTNGYLTETAGNTVNGTSGYIITTRTINAPSALNVAGLGAVLTTGVNLGSTEIRRGHTQQNNLSGNPSILRYYDITPTTNTGLNATMVFNFDESELNGRIESALSLFRSTNTGSTWTARGGTVNTALNNITLTSIDALSRWSASSTAAVASTFKIIIEGFYNISTTRLNMRDTVRAYLRNNTTPFAVVDSAKSIIDSVTHNGSFLFSNAPTGTYYIQTKHRNALETWSKSGGESYTLGSSLNYDFTTSLAQAFGNNMIQKGTKFCLYSGDILQDGIIDGSDGIIVDNSAANFESGYIGSDVNGDRFVDGSDAAIVDNNAANFVSVARP